MAEKIDVLLPVYNERVKVSSWSYNNQGLPFDNSVTQNKGASHYKSFGPSDKVYIPKTSAKEAMEIGAQKFSKYTTSRRSVVNFTSFPLVNEIVDSTDQFDIKVQIPFIPMSTYTKDFHKSDLPKHVHYCDTVELNPLLNRRPKNEFLIADRVAPDKFMDSHFYDIPPNRKCINYLRQIRTTSKIF